MQEIVAVVNEDALSARDLDKRLKLITASSGLKNTKDIRERLTPQILESLIGEKIMLQEARKIGISITQEDIEQGFAQIAAQNKQDPAKFKTMLKRGGIDLSTMEAQIEAQVAWSKVVQSKLRPRIIVSDRDIDDALERMTAKAGAMEYLAAEIFLPITNSKKKHEVKKLADRLVREVKSGKASFFSLAQQFSQSAGALNGGDTGWLHETQIDPEILNALQVVGKNSITKPVETLKGYHVLFVRDTRRLTDDQIPSREEIEFQLGIERLERLQRRHLSDLRSSSFVDIRL